MEFKDKKSYYAIIPADVRYEEKLCANAKMLYGEISALCNEKGYCWASNDYFAKLYNVHKNTISRWISLLDKLKFIKVKYDLNMQVRTIWINERIDTLNKKVESISKIVEGTKQKAEGTLNEIVEGTKQKAEHNNTINNTVNNTENNKQESKDDSCSFYKETMNLVYKNYESIYKTKMSIGKKEGKTIKEIINRAKNVNIDNPLSVITEKITILKQEVLNDTGTFWKFTPEMLLSHWNKLAPKPKKEFKINDARLINVD